ncbi:MAG TPA: antibiotic biosynthesis monooxygenase [Micropruina sp.]|nr:antibiotic biosynthesis monooxygenase [Propionibacterium sp.]HMQ37847.1 antibiotic biosynthesis monooxygenase [Micropruina sp.]HMR22820.1 antibiotic biosynthesis monooxygenase [Micropruina sp.]
MLAVNRFRVLPQDEDDFFRSARAAVDFMASREGAESIDLVRNLDEPDLWAIVGRWANVGSYRRAFNGYEAKVVLVPLLSRAIDEPGAYDVPDDVGTNLPRSR